MKRPSWYPEGSFTIEQKKKKKREYGIHQEPENVIYNPICRSAEPHHPHHYAHFYLCQTRFVNYLIRRGRRKNEKNTSFSKTTDTTIVGNSILKARVKNNGPNDDLKSRVSNVPILGICEKFQSQNALWIVRTTNTESACLSYSHQGSVDSS